MKRDGATEEADWEKELKMGRDEVQNRLQKIRQAMEGDLEL